MDADRLAKLLKHLVGIPSVNPHHGPEDPAHLGEARMAAFVGDYLEQQGFDVAHEEQLPARPNVIAAFGPRDGTRELMLEAHLDTVSTRDMTVDPFGGAIRNGRLYGRGACDTKGPMAAALGALDADVLHQLSDAGCRVWFVGAIDEEAGAAGAAHLAESRRVAADECIVLEPTGLDLVHAHKGVYWFELETRGKTAHGANPGLGINAIDGMGEAVRRLRRLLEAQDPSVPLMDRATLNVGRIEGGSAVNIVPGGCRVEADLRTPPGTDHRDVESPIRQCLDGLADEGAIAGYRLETIKACPPFSTPADCPLATRLADACRAEGRPPATRGTGWFSDAGPLAAVCREVLVFGPGSIDQAHAPDEFIDLAELDRGRRILRRLLAATARSLQEADGT